MPLPVRSALWFTFAGITLKAIAMLTTPIFTRIMTTDQYGLYSLYNSWFQVLMVITTFRLTAAVFNKGMSIFPEARDEYTATMQTTSTALVVVAMVVYAVFHGRFDAITGLPSVVMIAMFSELLFSPSVAFWTARERYDYHYRPVVIVTVGISALTAIAGVVAVVMSGDKAVARILAGAVVSTGIGIAIYVRNIRRAGRLFVPAYARYALMFNLPLVPHYLSMYALDQLDRIMVARMVSLSAAAIYSVGYTVGLAIRVATDSASAALIPWQYRQLEADNLRGLGRRLSQVFVLYAFFVLFFVALAPELVAVLGGSAYQGAIYVVPPVSVATFFIFAYMMFGNIEVYYDATKMMTYGSVVAAVANVALNAVYIPRFGYVAAGYTTLACYGGLAAAHYVYVTRVVRVRVDGGRIVDAKVMLGLTAGLLAGMALLVATYQTPGVRYVLIVLGCVGLYLQRTRIRALLGSINEPRAQ